MPISLKTGLQAIACRALAKGFSLAKPTAKISDIGYVGCIEDNLLPGVSRAQFETELRKGDGNELESKFLAAHSSSALVVNCFAPFKIGKRARELALAGTVGFNAVTFERKCPPGLRGGTAPNLDLVSEGQTTVVAMESKCTEYFGVKVSRRFSPAYSAQIHDERRDGPWFASMESIISGNSEFLHLDVPQLIKHAFGLARCFKGIPTILLYVFWEPANAFEFPIFEQHRDEIRRFQKMVNGSFPQFISMSYPELWDSWASQVEVPSWLIEHIASLRERYFVSLA
ncbi:MAG: hypothetical protein WCA22_16405 [Candidatus Binatus sp.]